MIPTIVARNIASSCHAFFETPAGTGTSHRITPVAIEAISGFIAAPCHGTGAGAGASGFAGTAAADAFTVKLGFLIGDLSFSDGNLRWCGPWDRWRLNAGDCLVEIRWLTVVGDRNPRLTEVVNASDAIVMAKRRRFAG
ncbi:hypothetical protein Hanom_Chr01g00071211 [Helianthus anomalus]